MATPDDRRIVLATRNQHKIVELREILAPALASTGLELVGLDEFPGLEDVVESGVTFAENALLKARYVAAATGLPALADDSGLAVDVLGGAPGVFSARWSGGFGKARGLDKDEANNRLLLAQLADVPDQHRGAGFVCAAALVLPGSDADPATGTTGEEVVREGHCRGVVGRGLVGQHGFGYDPLLVRPDGRTLAQHSAEEKNAISHRSKALRELTDEIAIVVSRVR